MPAMRLVGDVARFDYFSKNPPQGSPYREIHLRPQLPFRPRHMFVDTLLSGEVA